MAVYRFDRAVTPEGWIAPAFVETSVSGEIVCVSSDAPATFEPIGGIAIPAMPNLHSHAFQRAMAGLTERAGPGDDSFWTWRELMYGFVGRLSPDDLEAIATWLYIEMLKSGYASVGEFHYVHHAAGGDAYSNPAEMSLRLLRAAEAAGIGMALLPVLYATGGFGGAALNDGQRRFSNDADGILEIIRISRKAASSDAVVGLAPHSLRAVPPELLAEAVAGLHEIDDTAPVHIHIAEQQKEVADCEAWSGARPVQWLLDNATVDERWCLVHATHLTDDETDAIAGSGAVAGLCPTTEANLGDGLFPLPRYLATSGTFGVGSDSHISISPIEELRWLEYGQRLVLEARNVAAGGPDRSTGARLWQDAALGGARALGLRSGALVAGSRADIVVLDGDSPLIAERDGDAILDSLVFAGNVSPIRDVMVGGRWAVRDGCHPLEAESAEAYRRALARLTA